MQKEKEKKTLYDSPKAATYKQVEGWVSSTGRFFGKDEASARYDGSTHKKCSCGKLMQKWYTKCEKCRANDYQDNYLKVPFKAWDFKTPLYDDASDQYFWEEGDLEVYLEEEDKKPEDLKLYICVANYITPIDTSLWEDIFPEDYNEKHEIERLVDEFNEKIKLLKPVSWSPGKFRTSYEKSLASNNTNGQ